MTPKAAKTVPCPMIRGTAAAIGVRKTSSSTMISTGAAISSARWAPSVVASFRSRPRTDSPERCASTGGLTRSSMNFSSGSTIVLLVSPFGTSMSSGIIARHLPSGSPFGPTISCSALSPPAHGDRTR